MQQMILLIDDDQEEQDILNEALNRVSKNTMCVWANGYEHASRMLRHIAPNFIFIDINMPGIDGITCLEELRKNKHLDNVPMVIYSTYVSDDTNNKAKEKGALCCIQKPDNIELFVHKLSNFLNQYKSLQHL